MQRFGNAGNSSSTSTLSPSSAFAIAPCFLNWALVDPCGFRRPSLQFKPGRSRLTGARPIVYASAQAASVSLRVAPGLQSCALAMSGGIGRNPHSQAAFAPGARRFRRAAGSCGISPSVWLATASLLWANGGLTIHSSRSRFAARLNSGVRPLTATEMLLC